jgi:hypothetical protein
MARIDVRDLEQELHDVESEAVWFIQHGRDEGLTHEEVQMNLRALQSQRQTLLAEISAIR